MTKNKSRGLNPAEMARAGEIGAALLLLADEGGRPPHIRAAQVFVEIARSGGAGITQEEIVRRAKIPKNAVSRWCQDLGPGRPLVGESGRGLIESEKQGRDSRWNYWKLTTAGNALWKRSRGE